MHPTAIEAAEQAYHRHLRNHLAQITITDDRVALNDVSRDAMTAAITAALAALAPDIRAAVRMLSGAAQHYVDAGWRYGEMDDRTEQAAEGVNAARRDLFALLGIPEDGA